VKLTRLFGGVALVAVAAAVGAKLPQPTLSDEQKAAADAKKAKAAHAARVEAYQLCASMDRVAEKYAKEMRAKGKEVKATETKPCADPGPFQAAQK
jgi:hypothetical protein